MKKFSFSLDNVLGYKQQLLDALMNEHAAIMVEIRNEELLIEALKDQYEECSRELKEKQMSGITVMDIYAYDNYLDVLAYRVKQEQEVLVLIKKKEELKRRQVVEARKESTSIEHLREKKLNIYNKAVQKEEELLIEEFVANSRNRSQAG